jgi:phosphoglycerol transferase
MNNKINLFFFSKLTLLQICVTILILALSLGLDSMDFSVPFNFWGDTLWQSVPIKSLIENSNPYFIPNLSAPYGLPSAGFPCITNLDWLVMKCIAFVNRSSGFVLNVFWLFTIILTSFSCSVSLHLLGLKKKIICSLLGISYALLPYAFFRNVAHINLVYYAVPPICLFVIHLSRGFPKKNNREIFVVGILAIATQGFGYLYYTFYTLILLFVSTLIGYCKNQDYRILKIGTLAIFVSMLCSVVNLTPTFYSWNKYGKPDQIGFKTSQESEIYAIKLRQMLVPNKDNCIPLLSLWGKNDASIPFPNENENKSARLGLLASIGFLILLLNIMGRLVLPNSKRDELLDTLSAFTIFIFLVATVGGIGAIINQIITEFRCYNRISVFISFFALAGLAIWYEYVLTLVNRKYIKNIILMLGSGLYAIGIYDQLLDAKHLKQRLQTDSLKSQEIKSFVQKVEHALPIGSSIFQLPARPFPLDASNQQMLPYDHAYGYLNSDKLRWSWPSFTMRHKNWQNTISELKGRTLLEALVISGFTAIWIDKNGYTDQASSVIDDLKSGGAVELLASQSARYVILDLRPVAGDINSKKSSSQIENNKLEILNQPTITFEGGFYNEECNQKGIYFRWSKNKSTIQVTNLSGESIKGFLVLDIASCKVAKILISGGETPIALPISTLPAQARISLKIAPHECNTLTLISNSGRIDLPPGETRDLCFYILRPKFEFENQ